MEKEISIHHAGASQNGSLESPYATDPNLKAFRCRFSGCKETVGLTDGVRLYVAGMVIAHRVSFACAHCGYEAVWRPVLKPIAAR